MSEEAKPSKPAAQMVTTVWEGALPELLRNRLGEAMLGTSSYVGQNFVEVAPGAVVQALQLLRDEAGFDYLVDITGVHYPKRPQPFDVHYILYSFSENQRVRLRTALLPEQTLASVTGIYEGANWMERELFDMFGIVVTGHPELKRILLPDEWQGHPLRKDYGITQMDQSWVQTNLGIEKGQ